MDNICLIHGMHQTPYTEIEAEEFKQMLKDRPEVRKHYESFFLDSCQAIRSRIGGGIYWDDKLDRLFEIAAISKISPDDKPTKSLSEQRAWQKRLRESK